MEKIGISDKAQDILEDYWVETQESHKGWSYACHLEDPVMLELREARFALDHTEKLELTDQGLNEARHCIRRHRLAERLFADVLDIKGDMIEQMGCKFEHMLQKEVEENICALLGHPNHCPHNKPIPQGACCYDQSGPRRMLRPLSECDVNETGKIAYLHLDRDEVANKLTALGVLPGLTIKLLRKSPGYLFQMGESQFVVDQELASKIQVRFSK